MNRRDFLGATGAAAAATALASQRAEAAGRARPNLMVIHTDEHNFRTLGCYRALMPKEQALMWGDTVVETPNVDWLAKEGAVATRFYATTPVCSPSRSSFVSGRYPQNTPVVNNNIPMSDDIVTFAEILRRQGYATGYAGKWHLDGTGKPQWAPKRKFGFTDNRYMFNRGHWKQLEDTPKGPRVKARSGAGKPNYDVQGADEKSFTTDFLADRTVEFVNAHKGEPFCYMVSIPDPHGPNTVRKPYDTMFASGKFRAPATMSKDGAGLPSWGRKQRTRFTAKPMVQYFGMVKCIDDGVGKIIAALRQAGILERTIVVFTADHGDLCGEHARDNKGVPHEGSAKVPFVLYCPGKIKPGTVVTRALGCVDFLPTVLALMGSKTAGKEEGRDASALFTGTAPADWKDVAFMRGTGGPSSNWLAAVTSRYKLVYSPRDEPWLLDLERDPNEFVNLFRRAECRETVRELSRELVAYCKTFRDPRGADPRIKADLAWAVEGEGEYKPPDVPAGGAPPGPGGSRRKKRRRKKKRDENQ